MGMNLLARGGPLCKRFVFIVVIIVVIVVVVIVIIFCHYSSFKNKQVPIFFQISSSHPLPPHQKQNKTKQNKIKKGRIHHAKRYLHVIRLQFRIPRQHRFSQTIQRRPPRFQKKSGESCKEVTRGGLGLRVGERRERGERGERGEKEGGREGGKGKGREGFWEGGFLEDRLFVFFFSFSFFCVCGRKKWWGFDYWFF